MDPIADARTMIDNRLAQHPKSPFYQYAKAEFAEIDANLSSGVEPDKPQCHVQHDGTRPASIDGTERQPVIRQQGVGDDRSMIEPAKDAVSFKQDCHGACWTKTSNPVQTGHGRDTFRATVVVRL